VTALSATSPTPPAEIAPKVLGLCIEEFRVCGFALGTKVFMVFPMNVETSDMPCNTEVNYIFYLSKFFNYLNCTG
jgi:hypothetical protein